MVKTKGLYLGEILERDGVEYGSNNLIISPTGSGKTHFIMNILGKRYSGKKLLLVSTTSLKDSFGNEVGTFTTQDLRRGHMDIKDEDLYVMTYSEFGNRIKWNDDFIEDYSVIFCDEIHSLMDYYLTHKANSMFIAIRTLFRKLNDIDVFYFTATTDKIDEFINKEYGDLYRDVNVIDYSNNKDIRQYVNVTEIGFTNVDGIESVLDNLGNISVADFKGVIFNERIDGMDRIKALLDSEGYKSISIWSVNNKDNLMNEEQLRVRSVLLSEGYIPNEYDFIIINGAMREGWNLLDSRVEVVIANTLDETNKVQVRGRVRKNLSLFAFRVDGDNLPIDLRIMRREKKLKVIERYLGKEISNEDKEAIANELNVIRESDGNVVKWTTISNALKNNGYKIDNFRKRVDGKQKTFSIITRVEPAKPSSESRAARFIAKLDELKFTEQNEKTLNSYMKKGKSVAFMHIKSSYKKKVLSGDWSERKFADITYLIARDKKLFSEKFYSEYGRYYGTKITEMEILTERAKYEAAAKDKLSRRLEEDKRKREEENKELLTYIAQNSSR